MAQSMQKALGYCVAVCLWISAVAPSYCQSGANESSSSIAPVAKVRLTLNRQRCRVGTPIAVRFEIENTGSVPFYIPPVVEDMGSLGGFYVQVTSPPGTKAQRSVVAGDPIPGFHRDIVTDARQKWIVLRPGDFYGATRELNTFVPLSPGRFEIVVRHSAPRLSAGEEQQLRGELKFPVLLDALESAPVYLEVVK
jgi:hypothetical protein